MPFTIMVSKFAIIKKKTNFIIIGLFDHHFGQISKMPLQINLCKDIFCYGHTHMPEFVLLFIGRQTIFLDPLNPSSQIISPVTLLISHYCII